MTIFEVGEVQLRAPHLAADLLELLTAIDFYGKTSISKNDALSIFNNSVSSVEDLDDILAEEVEELASNKNENNTKLERQIEDIWFQLSYRDKAFEDFYPFDVKHEQISLNKNLTPKQRYYLFLLACSRLKSFKAEKGVTQRWAGFFTEIAKDCLKKLLPSNAIVKNFDANSPDRREFYSTKTPQAIKKLGSDLNARVHTKECDELHSSGDAGIDLVGIVQFKDDVYSNIAIFAQSTCQQLEWPSKIIDANPDRLSIYFDQIHPIPAFFIPISYRNSNGSWVNNKHTGLVVLIDRLRLLHTLATDYEWNNSVLVRFEEEFSKFKNVNSY